MKTLSSIMLATFLLNINFSYAGDAHTGGNGGNSIAGHFTTIASNIGYVWEDICLREGFFDKSCDHLGYYKDLLSKRSNRYVVVKSQEKVYADDENEREAVNNGVDSITVSESKWTGMANRLNGSSRRTSLVMHEYFTILGTDASDFYEGSNQVLSLIKRTGFSLEKIAEDELLPSRCSINIIGNHSDFIRNDLKEYLRAKNYEVARTGEKTRYTLKLKTECIDKFLHNSCTIYSQLKDNLKDDNIQANEEIISDAYLFKSHFKLLKSLLQSYQERISNCTL